MKSQCLCHFLSVSFYVRPVRPGRPFPLKGRYFANVFVHFEPKGFSQRFYESFTEGKGHYQPAKRQYRSAKKQTIKDLDKVQGQNDLPPYVEKGGLEEKLWNASTSANLRTKVCLSPFLLLYETHADICL